MKPLHCIHRLMATCFAGAALLSAAPTAKAHCDSLDGPVVKAAQRALAERNVNHAVIWVRPQDEGEIRQAFDRTLAVRGLGPQARELADRYFFEVLVRVHRTGEGAPYTGLKPAGSDPGPAVVAGDQALRAADLEPVLKLLSPALLHRLRERFDAALAKGRFPPNDVDAGRAYVLAYVSYIHFVEAMHHVIHAGAHHHPADENSSAVDRH